MYIFYDTETSGLERDFAQVLQVALKRLADEAQSRQFAGQIVALRLPGERDAKGLHEVLEERMFDQGLLGQVGLTVTEHEQCSASHSATAAALLRSFRADAEEIAGQIGTQALTELITAHELWTEWLRRGRVRKFALVAEKR